MSTWKRTALGSGGSESTRNVLEFDNATAYSGYSYFYSTPMNMITTKASGNLFIYQEIRPASTTQKRVTIYDPYLNVLANGAPSIMFAAGSNARWSSGQPNLSDSSIGASGYGQDDVVVGYGGTYNYDSASVKATGLPSGYNHNEIKLNTQYYNSNSAWYNCTGFKTHRIGNKAYDLRNHNSDGWAFMSYKYPTGNETEWYTTSHIQGQNPGRYISSGGAVMFEPLSPTSMTTDFLIGYSVPYGACNFKTMDYLGAPKSTGRSGYVSNINSNFQYWSPAQIDRANNEAYMFDSDQMILIKWNYSNGTITLYQVNLPGGVNRTQHSYPMVLLNGYLYLMAYSQNNSTGAMYIIRMSASNPTSNYVYKIYNTQGARQVSGFNMVEGPNNALGETDLLSIAFEYRSNSNNNFTDMIIGNMLFGDLPQLASSGQVGAKLIVQGSTTTINNVTSSYTTYSQASSSSISTMYTGNQNVGYPGMNRTTNPWQSHSASFDSGLTKTSL